MTDQPPQRPEKPTGQSFTATPADSARTYQTARDQTINEHNEHHHHYAPRTSLRTGVAWSVAGAVIVAMGAFVGVDLWDRHTAAHTDSDAAVAGDTTTTRTPPSPSPSLTPSPSTTPTASGTEPAAPAASTPAVSASGALPNPAHRCSALKPTYVPNVQAKSCVRIADGRLYMNAEWRATSGHALVDVYLWLEDGTSTQVVYPATGVPREAAGQEAWPTPRTERQWTEFAVDKDLVQGVKYNVSVSVWPEGSGPPNIGSPKVTGTQQWIIYS
ncbi:hypothetical protein [Streptomyces camelliae]|uniref:Uncharacterized protein n=1 Tax=Streptomyces camelliae TaxID=3004093 RepID=A0ABY7P3N1_9ACTN|nr:hypothetical protein [Streptomyces sp. HUAS 2-6]WBO64920.1 hypothetical protein O1G22_19825 [Streptomyces sp. HUAS 2-6]